MSCFNAVTLQVLLHYYTRPVKYAEHEPEHAKSQAVREAHIRLVEGGLIECSKPASLGEIEFTVTDKGRVFIEYILALPFPSPSWSMP